MKHPIDELLRVVGLEVRADGRLGIEGADIPEEPIRQDQPLEPIREVEVAQALGVSITPGKDATLIIADGDILETESNVTEAFIQGRAVDLGNRHKTLYRKYQRKYDAQR